MARNVPPMASSSAMRSPAPKAKPRAKETASAASLEPEDEDPDVSYFMNMTKDLTKNDVDLLRSVTVKRLQQLLIGG